MTEMLDLLTYLRTNAWLDQAACSLTDSTDTDRSEGMTVDVRSELDQAASLREATPGRPEDGPYPATVGEVADEVVAWLYETNQTSAPGLVSAVRMKLIADIVNQIEES